MEGPTFRVSDNAFHKMLRTVLQIAGINVLPYFSDHKTHPDFFVRLFKKNNDECILILVVYWKKTGLVHTKISNHNIIYSS